MNLASPSRSGSRQPWAWTAVFALVCSTIGCGSKPAPPSEPIAPSQSPGAAAGPRDTDTGLTGVLSEDDFAKLHELRDDAAPPARGSMIELAGARAYLSLPADATPPVPGIVVIHEWWGLNEHIQHWADRLAADGYAALAVDLYGGEVATEPDEAMRLMKAVDPARAEEILVAAHRFLADDARILARRRGVIGWCFGGGWSLQHAIVADDVDAAVIYYGRLVTDPKTLAEIEAPVLGIFGNHDEGIPPASVDAFANAMKQAGRSLQLHRYDAEHAFANPSSVRYQPAAAAEAWEHVRSFLAEHLRDVSAPNPS